MLLAPSAAWGEKKKKSRGRTNRSTSSESQPSVSSERITTSGRGSEGDYVIEKRSDGTTVKYKKKEAYDFEGADVEGLFKKPSGSYISNIQGVKGRTIIRIRKNFDAEVVDSTRALR